MKKYRSDLATDKMKQARNAIRALRRNYKLSGDIVRILKWNKESGGIVVKFGDVEFEVDAEDMLAIESQFVLHLHCYRINQHARRIKYDSNR